MSDIGKKHLFVKSFYGMAFALAVMLMPSVSHGSIDTIAVDVGISVFKTMPIGVIPFAETKGIDWIEEKPHQIVTRDAQLSGRFDVVPSDRFNLPLFSKAHAKHYVTGKVAPVEGGKLKLECYLYVAQTKDLLLGEAYTVAQKDLRRAMHKFFDEGDVAWLNSFGGKLSQGQRSALIFLKKWAF